MGAVDLAGSNQYQEGDNNDSNELLFGKNLQSLCLQNHEQVSRPCVDPSEAVDSGACALPPCGAIDEQCSAVGKNFIHLTLFCSFSSSPMDEAKPMMTHFSFSSLVFSVVPALYCFSAQDAEWGALSAEFSDSHSVNDFPLGEPPLTLQAPNASSSISFEPLPETLQGAKLRSGNAADWFGNHSVNDFPLGEPPLTLQAPNASSSISFEPLPETLQGAKLRSGNAADWFDEPYINFPRGQLRYHHVIGRGWFGEVSHSSRKQGLRVIHGEATGLQGDGKRSAVIVKRLHDYSSPSQQIRFLLEATPWRDTHHPNVVRLFGRCLETDPFLLIFEKCPMGEVKAYLGSRTPTEAEAFRRDGTLLRMAKETAAGLAALHEKGFTHPDLASHTCYLTSDLSVKVGDYGWSLDRFPDDYVVLNIPSSTCSNRSSKSDWRASVTPIPLRWCAPESLKVSQNSPCPLTLFPPSPEANVWSLAVTLWEIFMMGHLPYEELSEEGVLDLVIVRKNYRLKMPSGSLAHKERIYQLLQQCWYDQALRPSASQVYLSLSLLHSSPPDTEGTMDFEARWNAIRERSGPIQASIPFSIPDASLKFESDFDLTHVAASSAASPPNGLLDNPLDAVSISPSLRILRGSFEDLPAFRIGQEADSFVSLPPETFLPFLSPNRIGQEADSFVSRPLQTASLSAIGGELDSLGFSISPMTGADRTTAVDGAPLWPDSSSAKGSSVDSEGKEEDVPLSPSTPYLPPFSAYTTHETSSSTGEEEGAEEGGQRRKGESRVLKKLREKSRSVHDFLRLTVLGDSDEETTVPTGGSAQALTFVPRDDPEGFGGSGGVSGSTRSLGGGASGQPGQLFASTSEKNIPSKLSGGGPSEGGGLKASDGLSSSDPTLNAEERSRGGRTAFQAAFRGDGKYVTTIPVGPVGSQPPSHILEYLVTDEEDEDEDDVRSEDSLEDAVPGEGRGVAVIGSSPRRRVSRPTSLFQLKSPSAMANTGTEDLSCSGSADSGIESARNSAVGEETAPGGTEDAASSSVTFGPLEEFTLGLFQALKSTNGLVGSLADPRAVSHALSRPSALMEEEVRKQDLSELSGAESSFDYEEDNRLQVWQENEKNEALSSRLASETPPVEEAVGECVRICISEEGDSRIESSPSEIPPEEETVEALSDVKLCSDSGVHDVEDVLEMFDQLERDAGLGSGGEEGPAEVLGSSYHSFEVASEDDSDGEGELNLQHHDESEDPYAKTSMEEFSELRSFLRRHLREEEVGEEIDPEDVDFMLVEDPTSASRGGLYVNYDATLAPPLALSPIVEEDEEGDDDNSSGDEGASSRGSSMCRRKSKRRSRRKASDPVILPPPRPFDWGQEDPEDEILGEGGADEEVLTVDTSNSLATIGAGRRQPPWVGEGNGSSSPDEIRAEEGYVVTETGYDIDDIEEELSGDEEEWRKLVQQAEDEGVRYTPDWEEEDDPPAPQEDEEEGSDVAAHWGGYPEIGSSSPENKSQSSSPGPSPPDRRLSPEGREGGPHAPWDSPPPSPTHRGRTHTDPWTGILRVPSPESNAVDIPEELIAPEVPLPPPILESPSLLGPASLSSIKELDHEGLSSSSISTKAGSEAREALILD
ncbi:unnamed protein product [Cyprideis torosa]|uniref:Uncharacterized protein n=1 Tax=Cyprideis torosa TaxID=163714 RepID=A0A7R8ZKC7_9CRUS|nr:unnamed protein product [Cyprideis torosa]CAG0890591.1 unnamed protein product [Cyprideis torosa]